MTGKFLNGTNLFVKNTLRLYKKKTQFRHGTPGQPQNNFLSNFIQLLFAIELTTEFITLFKTRLF